jgi:hypothetical protein
VGIGNVTFPCDATLQANGPARYQCSNHLSMQVCFDSFFRLFY